MKNIGVAATILLPIIAILLIVSQFICTNELVAISSSVKQMDSEIEKTQASIEDFEQQIASASSFAAISKKAEELGFIVPQKAVALTSSQFTVALHTQ